MDFLCRRFTYHARNAWEDQVHQGKILVNEKCAPPSVVLKAGDRVEYLHSDQEEPPVEKRYKILFEDETLLAVEKPGNLPCHPGGRYFENTLWHLLKRDCSLHSVYFVNRIDRETSGVVLVAKTSEAAEQCRKQFLEGTPRKRYLVAVEGTFSHDFLRAEGFIGNDAESLIRKKQRFFQKGGAGTFPADAKRCCTLFRPLKTVRGKTLLSAEPLTGRTHQIRATLCSIGYPVTGDKIYGVDETIFLRFLTDALTREDYQRLSLTRQALHAEILRLNHPRTGKGVSFVSAPPEDMTGLFSLPERCDLSSNDTNLAFAAI